MTLHHSKRQDARERKMKRRCYEFNIHPRRMLRTIALRVSYIEALLLVRRWRLALPEQHFAYMRSPADSTRWNVFELMRASSKFPA